jgi:hypothetical protein
MSSFARRPPLFSVDLEQEITLRQRGGGGGTISPLWTARRLSKRDSGATFARSPLRIFNDVSTFFTTKSFTMTLLKNVLNQ